MKKRGFTLVEIMMVIGIIGIILAMAIPSFINARKSGRQKVCLTNLKQIEQAKDQWAMELRRPNGAVVTAADLCPNYVRTATLPVCPGGGTYTVNVVGTIASCSVHGTTDAPVNPAP
jgi:prepilin-type N-terminal cleavage/methylation domain-containing protein